jgi:hypothetical protein
MLERIVNVIHTTANTDIQKVSLETALKKLFSYNVSTIYLHFSYRVDDENSSEVIPFFVHFSYY